MSELHETLEEIKYLLIRNLSFLINFPLGFIFGATFMYFCLDWG